MKFIPVAEPAFVGNEKKYVVDCMDSTWISSKGQYIDRFEEAFASFLNVKHAITCCNGTVALHLALMALGVKPRDEILVPTFTYVASANSVLYCGARPIFVDCESDTWNMDPSLIEDLVTEQTKGILPVHMYGHPVDMDPVLKIAEKYGLFVLEDAAEAHGATYKNRPVGTIGDIATFSFFGNKIITTGEGGMVVTNNDKLAGTVRKLKGQGLDASRGNYWHDVVGYNYRMTNLAASIGLAQIEKIDWHLARRRQISSQYAARLKHVPDLYFQHEKSWARNAFWMISLFLGPKWQVSRDSVIEQLAKRGIETRPFFFPMHCLPIHHDNVGTRSFPIADRISARGINLPSSAKLTEEEIDLVCEALEKSLLIE